MPRRGYFVRPRGTIALCEWCKNEHDSTYGGGRFCSLSCARRNNRSKWTSDSLAKAMKFAFKKGFTPWNKGRRVPWQIEETR